jgi:hypothetical protein
VRRWLGSAAVFLAWKLQKMLGKLSLASKEVPLGGRLVSCEPVARWLAAFASAVRLMYMYSAWVEWMGWSSSVVQRSIKSFRSLKGRQPVTRVYLIDKYRGPEDHGWQLCT